MSETLSDRLDAVERALTDGEADLTDVRDRAELSAEVERLESRVAELEAQLEELDAAVEAVRGYAGNVRAVNRDVERRASAALAKAEALEAALDAPEERSGEPDVVHSRAADPGETDGNRRPDNMDARETRLQSSTDGDSEDSGESVSTGADRGQDSQPHAPTVPPRTSTGDGRADEDSGTDQFIERVRDAL